MINSKEQTVLKSIKNGFERTDTQTQYTVLGYKTDLCFLSKLAIEVDELGPNDRNVDH